MRIRTILLMLLVVCIAASPAFANKETGKFNPSRTQQVYQPDGRDLFEGFEGAWPPAGWTAVSETGHSGVEHWFQGYTSAFEGSASAECQWDPDYIAQNNTLSFDYLIGTGENHLNFQISGSEYWSINYDCTVEVNGTEMYSWAAHVVDNWVFQLVDVDLSAYDGQTVTITFRYAGYDGAAIYLDAVGINEGYEPPPPPVPPVNDTCEGATDPANAADFEIPPGAHAFTGDNTLANSDYPLTYPSCTSYSFSGLDMVYFVCMDQGDFLDITFTPNPIWDSSIFLVTDCNDPQNTCVMGADYTISAPEVMQYTAEADDTYYLIVGGYSSFGVGPFVLETFLDGEGCMIPTDKTSWGGVKSLYR